MTNVEVSQAPAAAAPVASPEKAASSPSRRRRPTRSTGGVYRPGMLLMVLAGVAGAVLLTGCQAEQVPTLEGPAVESTVPSSIPGLTRDLEVTCPGGRVAEVDYDYDEAAGVPTPDQALDAEWKHLESPGEDAWTKQRYKKDGPTEAYEDREVLDLIEDGEVRVRLEAEQRSGGWVVSYATGCS